MVKKLAKTIMLRLQKNTGANQQPGQVLINNQTNIYQTSSQLLDEVLSEDEKDDVKSNIITNEKDLPSFNLD